MNADTAVTDWIESVRQGDEQAAQKIWDRYCTSLAALARKRLTGASQRATDQDDVVQEAFAAFFRAVRAGNLPQLADRDDLWRVLVQITENKARDLRKGQRRLKRGAGQVRGNSAFLAADGSGGLDLSPGAEPTPEFAAAAIEECRRLMDMLEDPQLRQIAMWKFEGFTREEIATRLDCVPETVGRKMRLIRTIWAERSIP